MRTLHRVWDFWVSDHLPILQENSKLLHTPQKGSLPRQPCLGEVVLIERQAMTRGAWALGTIAPLHHRADGEARSAVVKTANGNCLTRPVNMLYSMEVQASLDSKVSI